MYEVKILKSCREKSKNGGPDEVEHLALYDFVMAAQAADFCFSFYTMLWTHPVKKESLS